MIDRRQFKNHYEECEEIVWWEEENKFRDEKTMSQSMLVSRNENIKWKLRVKTHFRFFHLAFEFYH